MNKDKIKKLKEVKLITSSLQDKEKSHEGRKKLILLMRLTHHNFFVVYVVLMTTKMIILQYIVKFVKIVRIKNVMDPQYIGMFQKKIGSVIIVLFLDMNKL